MPWVEMRTRIAGRDIERCCNQLIRCRVIAATGRFTVAAGTSISSRLYIVCDVDSP